MRQWISAFSVAALATLPLVTPRLAEAVTVRHVPGRFNDVVYNPVDGALYASASALDSLQPNRVVRIDPATGLVFGSVVVGSDPRKLALSSDGSALYVGLDGTGSVRRVDLPSFTAGAEFSLGTDPFYGTLYVEDMAVQPGNPNVVAVSRRSAYTSPRHVGVVVFDNGVERPNRESEFLGSNVIGFSSSPSRLYGLCNESTSPDFLRMNVDANGITVQDKTPGLINDYGRHIEFRSGFLYSAGGTVIDPEGLSFVHLYSPPDYSYPTAVATDVDRVYYATNVYYGAGGVGIHILSRTSFTPLMRYTIGGTSVPTALQRWGTDGLALRGEDGALLVLDQILTPPTCELGLTKWDLADPIAYGNSIQYRIDVANAGPALAENITVRDTIPGNVQYEYAYSSNGYCYDSSGVMVCATSALAAGDAFYVVLQVRPDSTGFVLNRAYVSSTTPDNFAGNNMDSEVTEVVPFGFDQSDVQVSFVGTVPTTTVEGEPVLHTLEVRNNGPAAAANVWFNGYAYGYEAAALLEVVNGGAAACSSSYNSVACALGTLASGESRTLTLRLVPLGAGFFSASYSAYPSGPDRDYGNNYTYANLLALPSTPRLLDSLATAVRLLGLHHGPELDLLRQISAAKMSILARDTAATCAELADVQDRIARRTGRALDLDRAFSLFSMTRFIQQILGCVPGGPGSGDSLLIGTPIDVGSTELPGRRATALGAVPTELGLVLGAPGSELAPTVAMPEAGHVRLDLLDVQGRVVGTVFEGELPAGSHPLAWRGASPGSGIYFYRLLALRRQVVTKVSLVR